MSLNRHFKTFLNVLVKFNISYYSMFQAISQSKMSVSRTFFATDILQAPLLFSRRSGQRPGWLQLQSLENDGGYISQFKPDSIGQDKTAKKKVTI